MAPAEAPTPRDSAAAILLRPAPAGGWEILLGLRSRRSRFMPGHLSCPGGGLEPGDRPDEAGAYLRCVRRELLEETGIDVPRGRWIEAGERTTPPMFPVRFRTRFFVAPLDDRAAANLLPASGENESLSIGRPDTVLESWARGKAKLPPPILPILRTVAASGGCALNEVARQVSQANALEDRAPRIEFVPDVWMLPVRTDTLPPASHTNVWLPGGGRFVVVDPGSPDVSEQVRLLEVVERRRALGHRPVAVVLTHHHRDHVSGVRAAARALEVPVRAHPVTLEALDTTLDGLDRAPLDDEQTIDLDGMTLRRVAHPGPRGRTPGARAGRAAAADRGRPDRRPVHDSHRSRRRRHGGLSPLAGTRVHAEVPHAVAGTRPSRCRARCWTS